MKKNELSIYFTAILLLFMNSCEKIAVQQQETSTQPNAQTNISTTETAKVAGAKDSLTAIIIDDTLFPFIPENYTIYEKTYGDLNNDGLADCIITIKGLDKTNIIIDKYNGKLDRNRRGIVILLKQGDGYTLASKNYDCFSSENEDGGVYFAPELGIEAKKGNLLIHYSHGRYGYWSYTFRLKQSDLELIGYDETDNRGPVVNRQVSINFLSKKKLERVNVNENAEGGEEIFEEKWQQIDIKQTIKLSEIADFDELDVNELK